MKNKIDFKFLARVFLLSLGFVVLIGMFGASYVIGYSNGAKDTSSKLKSEIEKYMANNVSSITYPTPSPEPTSIPNQNNISPTNPPQQTSITTWGGPQLWEAVNNKRVEYGVNSLSQKSELCTIASIRLNELLELGKLDGHEGFSDLPDRRPDLLWIFEKYNISEFLVSGAESPDHAVSLWDNTLGHKKLLTGGEYVWGCIYAQNSVGVAIAAY